MIKLNSNEMMFVKNNNITMEINSVADFINGPVDRSNNNEKLFTGMNMRIDYLFTITEYNRITLLENGYVILIQNTQLSSRISSSAWRIIATDDKALKTGFTVLKKELASQWMKQFGWKFSDYTVVIKHNDFKTVIRLETINDRVVDAKIIGDVPNKFMKYNEISTFRLFDLRLMNFGCAMQMLNHLNIACIHVRVQNA